MRLDCGGVSNPGPRELLSRRFYCRCIPSPTQLTQIIELDYHCKDVLHAIENDPWTGQNRIFFLRIRTIKGFFQFSLVLLVQFSTIGKPRPTLSSIEPNIPPSLSSDNFMEFFINKINSIENMRKIIGIIQKIMTSSSVNEATSLGPQQLFGLF